MFKLYIQRDTGKWETVGTFSDIFSPNVRTFIDALTTKFEAKGAPWAILSVMHNEIVAASDESIVGMTMGSSNELNK